MGNQQFKLDWIKYLNITAKILTIFYIFIISLIYIGEGYNLHHLSTRELALSICFPFGVGIGMIITWFNEKIGFLLTVISFFGFYLIHLGFFGNFALMILFLLNFHYRDLYFLHIGYLKKKE